VNLLKNRIRLSFEIFCQVDLVVVEGKVKGQDGVIKVVVVAVVVVETRVFSIRDLPVVWWIDIILLMSTRP
jgi:hypothetical protein